MSSLSKTIQTSKKLGTPLEWAVPWHAINETQLVQTGWEVFFVLMKAAQKPLQIEDGRRLTWFGFISIVSILLEVNFPINVIFVINRLLKLPSFEYIKRANITSTER